MQANDMRLVNDLEQLYQDALDNRKQDDGSYACDVCGAKYKTEKGVVKHIQSQRCADIKVLMKGTDLELDGLSLFREIIEAPAPIAVFRRSMLYKKIMMFILFCYKNEVSDIGMYYEFSGADRDPLWAGIEESTLRDYRVFLQKNPVLIDPVFLQRNRDLLKADQDLLVRSIEKSHIAIDSILDDPEFEEIIDNLPVAYTERLMRFIDKTIEIEVQ